MTNPDHDRMDLIDDLVEFWHITKISDEYLDEVAERWLVDHGFLPPRETTDA